MISEYDIKKAVVDTLRRNFEYPVYEFGLVEGMEFPCLFARVWGKGEIETRNIYHQDYTVEIVMMYGKNEKGTEATVLKDMGKMRQAFLTHLKIEQRLLRCQTLTPIILESGGISLAFYLILIFTSPCTNQKQAKQWKM